MGDEPRSTHDASRRRSRVLISAYACGPGDEPEAAAGWAFAKAAAEKHDVWVITRRRFMPAIEAAFSDDPELRARINVIPLDLSPRLVAAKRGPLGVYWYYALWQRALLRSARELHARLDFDITHHVTFANDWLPCGLARLDGPSFVWGPVGGATKMPLHRLWRWLGVRGLYTEIVRIAVTSIPRRIFGDGAARRASVVVVQNDDVADRFRRARRIVVEPNAAFTVDPRDHHPQDPPTALFVARLLPLKGGRIAIESLADPRLAGWTLEVYGAGYERGHLERRAAKLGIADRVIFHGHRPRSDVIEAYGRADVLVFPSLHDQAGWAAAEASARGMPVVCLPLGGPPLVAERNAVVAPLAGNLATSVADAILIAAARGGTPHDRWSPDRLPGLVDEWYARALSDAP